MAVAPTPAAPPASMARSAQRVRQMIQGVSDAWFGPNQPLRPQAPDDTKGRLWDYPVAFNLNYQPRATQLLDFPTLRSLADNCSILRSVIETRKDQVETLDWAIHPKKVNKKSVTPTGDMQDRIDRVTRLFEEPSKDCDWPQFVRQILEQHFVYDAPSIEFVRNRANQICSLKVIDGATISVMLDRDGGTPAVPYVAYQQILKGLPAVDFTADELLYYPRNRRVGQAYGYPHVAQIVNTVELAIKRTREQLVAYDGANAPHGVMEASPTMTVDQITAMQKYWDGMFTGNQMNRAKTWWVPGGGKYTELTREILFNEFDEWLARVICYCFSISPTPFIKANNRATAEASTDMAHAEGTTPTLKYLKRMFNRIIRKQLMCPDLEFTWDDDVETDPAKQADMAVKYVSAGVITIDEVREDLGKDAFGGACAEPMALTGQGYVAVDPQERTDMATEAATKTAQAAPPGFQIGPDGKPMKPPPVLPPGAAGGKGAVPGKPGTKTLPGQKALPAPGKATPRPAAGASQSGRPKPKPAMAKADGLFRVTRQLANPEALVDWAKGLGLSPVARPELVFTATADPGDAQSFVLAEGYTPRLFKDDTGFWLYFDCAPLEERANEAGAITNDESPDWTPVVKFAEATDGQPTDNLALAQPFKESLLFGPEEIIKAWDLTAHDADLSPSEAQQAAGNYRKGHLNFQGLDLSIENPAGSVRSWANGEQLLMPAHYGYIKRTLGADGDHLDCFVGENPGASNVYVIDQHETATGSFDEHKVMLGYDNWTSARKTYEDSFTDNAGTVRIGNAQMLSMDQFKRWLATGDTTQPMGFFKGVTMSTGLYGRDQGPIMTPHTGDLPEDGLEGSNDIVSAGAQLTKIEKFSRWRDY